MKKYLCLIVVYMVTANFSWAKITVNDKVLQKGIFLSPECAKLNKSKLTAECFCEGDIHYPELSGLTISSVQAKLNKKFKTYAEASKCPGKPTKHAVGEMRSQGTLSFEVTYQAADILAIVNALYAYTAHAAHGGEAVDSYIIDTRTGALLTPQDMFGGNLARVNQYIYGKLTAMDDIFPEEVEKLKGNFITAKECFSCALMLTKAGVKVVFQQYAVAPYASGMPEVAIPKELIVNPSITQNLGRK